MCVYVCMCVHVSENPMRLTPLDAPRAADRLQDAGVNDKREAFISYFPADTFAALNFSVKVLTYSFKDHKRPSSDLVISDLMYLYRKASLIYWIFYVFFTNAFKKGS